jgi:hypothetical protein
MKGIFKMKKFLSVLAIIVLMFVGIGSTNAQDFTLSKNAKFFGTFVYEGTVLVTGDSGTVTLQGMDNTYMKDFAVDTTFGVVKTTIIRDTVKWTTIPSDFIRVKVADSITTKYSNYIDISAFDPTKTYISAVMTRVSYTVWQLYVRIWALGWKADIPQSFINSR